MSGQAKEHAERRAVMAVLAEARLDELREAWGALEGAPGVADLRRPEIGLVMVRGRIGGDGAPFNLGEATVTRAAVRLGSGETGFAYLLGRDPERARLAAAFEALAQAPAWRARVEETLLGPVRDRVAAADATRRAQAAATRVDFFTLVRGEDR